MRHGFKAQAERQSLLAREALGLSPSAPLDPWRYARHIGLYILDFETLDISAECKKRLLVSDSDSWSGMTLKEDNLTAIVINPSHTSGRQSSSLMHEIAHILLRHVPVRVEVSTSGLLLLSDYSDDAESEADWLAAAMLIPRDALIDRRRRGDTITDIATVFGTSEPLCEWRVRMTGVDVQLRRSAAR